MQDVAGTLDLNNVNGPITIRKAKGATKVRTINGDVTVNYLDVPQTASDYYTLNGELSVTYPASMSAVCQFKSAGRRQLSRRGLRLCSRNTINGDLIVGFKAIDPKTAMAFSTLNGKIDVIFPSDLKANVKIKAERGDIFSDFDVDVDKGQPNIEKRPEDHMYRINIDEWVYGKIGGGGPELMMKTTEGSVYVRKAK